jgi:serine/threonine protein kinase
VDGNDGGGGQSPAPASVNGTGGPVVDLGLPQLAAAMEIGRGSSGVVYRAEQPGINRTVAVKMLSSVMDDASRTRFERETRAMGALSSHPNIVTVFDAGFAPNGQPYIIMEFMAGGSLGDRLLRQGRLGWEEVVDHGIKVAGALDAAHKKGVLHRDIKPDNILISSYGEPKLADFSIARVHGALQTQTGLVSATPAHAAPEILRGDPPTEQADVYSLGSTLLTLLYGSPAFVRDTDTSIFPVLARVERSPVPDLRGLGVPDEVCRVLERAMAKDPAHRQQSALELAAELRSARDAIQGHGTAQIGPAPPPMLGATMVGLSPMTSPSARAATGTQPDAAIARPGPSNRAKFIIAGAGVGLVVIAAAALVLIKGGGSSATSTSSGGVASSSGATTAAVVGPIPATKILSKADLGAGYADFNKTAALNSQTPCNVQSSLPVNLPELDKAYQLQAQDLSLTVVYIDVATFPSGEAKKYLTALQTAVGKCGSWHQLDNGLDTADVIAPLSSGPPLGTGSVVRYEVQSGQAALTKVFDVIAWQQGDTVAMVINVTANQGDGAAANRIASMEATKLS